MEKTTEAEILTLILEELRSIRSLLEPKLKIDEEKTILPNQLVFFKDNEILPRKGFSRFEEAARDVIKVAKEMATPGRTVEIVSSKNPGKNTIQTLIAFYIDAWRKRYGTTARPSINRAVGVFKALLKERSPEEIQELIQVYCQMKDPWFQTRCHDIATFQANIDKVALALDKGREKPVGTDRDWREIDAERNGQNDS